MKILSTINLLIMYIADKILREREREREREKERERERGGGGESGREGREREVEYWTVATSGVNRPLYNLGT